MDGGELNPHARLQVVPDAGPGSRVLEAGTEVAGFVVEGLLAEEAEYVLYRASEGPGGSQCVLKLFDPSPLHDYAYFKALRRGARRWRHVRNPRVVRLVEAGDSEFGPYVATAPFEGMTLARVLEDGPFGPWRAIELGLEVADALGAALGERLSTGQVSPRDILVTPGGALVTDLGIAHARSRSGLVESAETVDYLSPEEARGETPLPQSAVYSLACVLYHCLTGAPPYVRDMPQAVVYAHLTEAPPLLSDQGAAPPQLEAVFQRAMAPDPEARHATPREFARDLAAAVGTVPVTFALPASVAEPEPAPAAVAPPKPQPQERPARRQRERAAPRPRPPAREPAGAPAPARAREARVRTPSRRRGALARTGRPLALAAAVGAFALAGLAVGNAGNDEAAPVPAAPPGPPPTAATARGVVADLGGRTALRRRLADASKRAGQADMAGRLAGLYGSAAGGVTDPGLRSALDDARGAYIRLAAAARRGRPDGFRRASAAVQDAESSLGAALRDAQAPRT